MIRMPVKYLVILCCFFLPLPAVAQDYDPARTYAPDTLKKDFAYLRAQLEKIHPNLYGTQSKSALEATFKRVELEFYLRLTEEEFLQRLRMLYAALGDGHTQFNLSEAAMAHRSPATLYFPFYLYFDNGKIYIAENCSANERFKPGMEFAKLAGKSLQWVEYVLASRQPRDGHNQTFPAWVVSTYFPFLFERPASPQGYDVQMVGDTGISYVRGLTRDSISYWRKRRYPGHVVPNHWQVRAEMQDSIAILAINSFDAHPDDKDETATFYKAIDNVFAGINRKHPRKLILDLRNNQGGDFETAKYLLTYLLQKPLSFLPGHAEGGVLKPAAGAWAGPLYVLINGGTFSVSAMVASYLQDERGTLTIGEESGGSASHLYGNPQEITLPYTKLRCEISTTDFYYRPQKSYVGGVKPEVLVKPRLEDIAAVHDVVKDTALALAKKQ